MIAIYKFNYESPVKNFSVFAPLKHGTRWLDDTNYKSKESVYPTNRKASYEEYLIEKLFTDKTSPFENSKIVLKKFKREFREVNNVFVYRDPYDSFIKAILTSLADPIRGWSGEPNELDRYIAGNNHFSPIMWQTLWNLFENLDRDNLVFVHLKDLSKYITINTLTYYPYDREKYSFEKRIAKEYTKEEVIELASLHHPSLWNNFMIQIEKETIALEKLKNKFGWDGK